MKKIIEIEISETKGNVTNEFRGKAILNNYDLFIGTLFDLNNNYVIVGYINKTKIDIFVFCGKYCNKDKNLVATLKNGYYQGIVFDSNHNKSDITCEIKIKEIMNLSETNNIINDINNSKRINKFILERYQKYAKMNTKSFTNEADINYIKRLIKK